MLNDFEKCYVEPISMAHLITAVSIVNIEIFEQKQIGTYVTH